MKELGFEVVNVTEVVESLKTKTTKVAQEVAERIETSEYYEVYTNGTVFIINSRFIATQKEQKQFAKFLKAEFRSTSSVLDEAGKWIEWTEAENGFVEEVAEAPIEVVSIVKESEASTMSTEQYHNMHTRNNAFRMTARR